MCYLDLNHTTCIKIVGTFYLKNTISNWNIIPEYKSKVMTTCVQFSGKEKV